MIYQPPMIRHRGTLAGILDSLLNEIEKTPQYIDWRVKLLQGYINSHDGNVVGDFDHVCRELGLGISGSYAARVFRQSIGIGLREYAKRRRLMVAADQLATTTRSIKEITSDLGYRSCRAFERRFRELFLLNPTEFRRALREAKARNEQLDESVKG